MRSAVFLLAIPLAAATPLDAKPRASPLARLNATAHAGGGLANGQEPGQPAAGSLPTQTPTNKPKDVGPDDVYDSEKALQFKEKCEQDFTKHGCYYIVQMCKVEQKEKKSSDPEFLSECWRRRRIQEMQQQSKYPLLGPSKPPAWLEKSHRTQLPLRFNELTDKSRQEVNSYCAKQQDIVGCYDKSTLVTDAYESCLRNVSEEKREWCHKMTKICNRFDWEIKQIKECWLL